MTDPYEILGLEHDASPNDIKQAYRLLARQFHPDSDRKNPRAEERFKELSAAYRLLSDADSRASYDRGEIDANGVRKRKPRGESGGGNRAALVEFGPL
jgi:curved DNA-binding protein CbpA